MRVVRDALTARARALLKDDSAIVYEEQITVEPETPRHAWPNRFTLESQRHDAIGLGPTSGAAVRAIRFLMKARERGLRDANGRV